LTVEFTLPVGSRDGVSWSSEYLLAATCNQSPREKGRDVGSRGQDKERTGESRRGRRTGIEGRKRRRFNGRAPSRR